MNSFYFSGKVRVFSFIGYSFYHRAKICPKIYIEVVARGRQMDKSAVFCPHKAVLPDPALWIQKPFKN
jgi:hypothetical protein